MCVANTGSSFLLSHFSIFFYSFSYEKKKNLLETEREPRLPKDVQKKPAPDLLLFQISKKKKQN